MSDFSALVVWGGWDGHYPEQVAKIFAKELGEAGFNVELSDTLDSFSDREKLKKLDLIIPMWTMGSITDQQRESVSEAVVSGVGLAGIHGGMCDAFRGSLEWQMLTGGQFVAHPGNEIDYVVDVKNTDHFITAGLPSHINIHSEQYYLLVDPSIKVLATTKFPTADGPHAANGEFAMPVVWTKSWGKGRVFYSSLGHSPEVVNQKEVLRLTTRGFLWAANAERAATA